MQRDAHRVYKGRSFIRQLNRVGWTQAGWSRITLQRDGESPVFDGSFSIDGNNHVIQRGSHYLKLKHDDDPIVDLVAGKEDDVMVVWRGTDVIRPSDRAELKRDNIYDNSTSCASDELGFNTHYNEEMRRSQNLGGMNSRSLFGRQNIDDNGGEGANVDLIASMGSTAGCPTTRRVALVGIATDCNYWSEFNGSSQAVRENVISMVNQASQLYENTFNIALAIQNLTVMEESCPGEALDSTPWNFSCGDGDINDRLNTFSEWRGRFEDTNAYWTLMTACNTRTAVGLAWRGQLCRRGSGQNGAQQGGGTIAATNVVVRTSTEWQIFAHETGHTFGAVHDCTADTCPFDENAQECCPMGPTASSCDAGGDFMMNPSTDPDITRFSPCSIGNICRGLATNIDGDCLTQNRNINVISGSQCGNGIVETGEECDCGGPTGCENSNCCNPETCQLQNNAVCDPANEECCTDQCAFASSSTVCRQSSGDCDPEEMCSGTAGHCPTDEHLDDGESCGDEDGLRCASGLCTSRDAQCRLMQGSARTGQIIGACERSNECQISCEGSLLGSNTCVEYQQNFLDGTPCGAGGHCVDGNCSGTSTLAEAEQWIRDNLEIVIPVAIVVGLLILLMVGGCIWRCIRRAPRKPKTVPPPYQTEMRNWPAPPRQPPPPGPGYQGYQYSPVPEPQQWNQQRSRSMRYA